MGGLRKRKCENGKMGKKRYSIHPHTMYILRIDDPHNLFPQPSPPFALMLKSYQLQYTILESVNQNHLFWR